MSYLPGFRTTPNMVNLIAEIVELASAFAINTSLIPGPTIRKINQLRSVHSTTWIEGNTLTYDEVTAIINGQRVVAPECEILEVTQAYDAYDAVDGMDPSSLDDLLRAHAIMMRDLTRDAGKLRTVEVGVYAGTRLIHAGTPASELPAAMEELFSWVTESADHPLIRGCFFHCAFEGIHPFADGNGRTGRLWHSLINRTWNKVMAWVPVESMVAQNQQEYYSVLRASNDGDATSFIEFMLEMERDALTDVIIRAESGYEDGVTVGLNNAYPLSTPQVPPKIDYLIVNLLEALGSDERSAQELMEQLGLTDRKHFRKAYLRPALDAGVIVPTIPEKPNSPKQKYRRTR